MSYTIIFFLIPERKYDVKRETSNGIHVIILFRVGEHLNIYSEYSINL